MNCQLSGSIGYRLLKALCKPRAKVPASNESQDGGLCGAAKLERFLGRQVWQELQDRRVLDFGCGTGAEAVAAAERGAACVYGLDIQESRLEAARRRAEAAVVADRCVFLNAATQTDEVAALEGTIDRAYSIDSFEHYVRPDIILERIHRLLAPGGRLLVSFGPPWKNPYGSHTWFFCHVPWMHLVFSETTIMAVRALYRDDGARKFADVEGGLNQMTLARFVALVERSPFKLDQFRLVPLSSRFVDRGGAWQRLFTNRLMREYFTSVVVAQLAKPVDAPVSDLLCDEVALASA